MEYGRKKINFYVAPITGTPQIAKKKNAPNYQNTG